MTCPVFSLAQLSDEVGRHFITNTNTYNKTSSIWRINSGPHGSRTNIYHMILNALTFVCIFYIPSRISQSMLATSSKTVLIRPECLLFQQYEYYIVRLKQFKRLWLQNALCLSLSKRLILHVITYMYLYYCLWLARAKPRVNYCNFVRVDF